MIPRITIADPRDAEVIKGGLRVYLEDRKRQYHRAAADADDETTLRLSVDYESDKEYVCGLLRAVGDGTMRAQTDTGSDEDHQEGKNDD